MDIKYLTTEELEAGLENIRQSPKDNGMLELIVRRPQIEKREVLSEGKLDLIAGLEGDNWKARGSSSTPDKSAHPEMQINIMNSRVIDLLAQEKERWQLAGDQLFIDIDLSEENLPAGTKLSIGDAILQISTEPHSGCKKFTARFGLEAMKFVNSPLGKELHLRGLNAKVIQAGVIRVGDTVRKV
ncbi:MAG: MOSC domain-containing protein [Anaerolineales bacterium]|nr:MOSC domain-containing protein [Anaerolineales bacterium]